MLRLLKNKIFFTLFSVALILLSALVFQNNNNQGINWTFPYFSGAANFERLFEWKISPSEYEVAKKLSDQEYRKYRHNETKETIISISNFYGYVLIAIASRILFPWSGDLNGIILFQIFIHVLTSLFILIKVFENSFQRYSYLFLYAANPLIIYFTTYPSYYFWTSIPSILFLIIFLQPRWRLVSIPLSVPVLLFSFMIRPTTLFLCIFIYLFAIASAAVKRDRWVFFFCLSLFAGGVTLLQGQSIRSPWHTMYVGLGAYSNNFGIDGLSDTNGYLLFHRQTGETIDTNPISGNYNNLVTRKQYDEILMRQYMHIANEYPMSLLRNAVLNTSLAFSIGYIVNKAWVNWSMIFLGLMVITLFVMTRQWVWLFSVLATSLGYTWYYPPIPAYHFGAYLLLVTGLIFSIQFTFGRKSRFGSASYPLVYK